MTPEQDLRLSDEVRADVWRRLLASIEDHWRRVDDGRVAPVLDPEGLRQSIEALDLGNGLPPADVIGFVVDGLSRHQVHTAHRRYYGLYNPSPSTMGVVADALVAAFNPQLAAWSHSPFAAEVEAYLVKEFGTRFGYPRERADGVFASGGAEANHTAVIASLVERFPEYRRRGFVGSRIRPSMYATSEAHDSLRKAASICGIGFDAVRTVPTTASLRMDADALRDLVASDRRAGLTPFLVVGTAGTTSAGIVDPLEDIAAVADENGLWFHADAAWGGAAVLSAASRPLLKGIERADSITFDAHKWLSVPMGAGIFLTRHPDALGRSFGTNNAYMPRDAEGLDIVDPFSHSIQWSRRFTGLKLFMTLAVAGWHGYARVVDGMFERGRVMRNVLAGRGWDILNETELPISCFAPKTVPPASRATIDALVKAVVASGRAWVSTALLGSGRACIRACVTNFATDAPDIEALADALDEARETAGAPAAT